jgi:hypothetical protein
MSEDSNQGSEGAGTSDSPPPNLNEQREQFLRTFTKGAQLTRDFLEEFETLQKRVRELENQNARLRAAIEADDAIRDLVKKIEVLEGEKQELLSRYQDAEAASSDVTQHFEELEIELSNLANLHVASNCLHSTMSSRGVGRRLKEILEQLMGVSAYCIYVCTGPGGSLTPITFEGLKAGELENLTASSDRLDHVLRTGAASIYDESDPSQGSIENPPAIIPLQIDDRVVGALAVVRALAHKTRLTTIDFELFKLLVQHAAAALMASGLYSQAGRVLPPPDAFQDLNR